MTHEEHTTSTKQEWNDAIERMLAEHNAGDSVEAQIRRSREEMKPSPVDLHHVPNWFRLALLKAYGCRDGWTNGQHVLQHAIGRAEWLDHWGSTKDGEQLCFVSEPYHVDATALAHVEDVARRAGCECWLHPNSWWYPGRTIRIAFAPKRGA